jgi:hypothetical protein
VNDIFVVDIVAKEEEIAIERVEIGERFRTNKRDSTMRAVRTNQRYNKKRKYAYEYYGTLRIFSMALGLL